MNDRKAIDVECPSCGAKVGEGCELGEVLIMVAKMGSMSGFHVLRVNAAAAATRDENRAARLAAKKG